MRVWSAQGSIQSHLSTGAVADGGIRVMGRFIYEGGPKLELDDRTLAHVLVVVSAKLRRGEPFAFTWREESSAGANRAAVWIHAQSGLVFKFESSAQPAINGAWIDALAATANAPTGLYIVHEPE
jgi:hypothetical protein